MKIPPACAKAFRMVEHTTFWIAVVFCLVVLALWSLTTFAVPLSFTEIRGHTDGQTLILQISGSKWTDHCTADWSVAVRRSPLQVSTEGAPSLVHVTGTGNKVPVGNFSNLSIPVPMGRTLPSGTYTGTLDLIYRCGIIPPLFNVHEYFDVLSTGG